VTCELKRQIKSLAGAGVTVRGADDVMLLSYVLDCGRLSHELAPMVRKYLQGELEEDKEARFLSPFSVSLRRSCCARCWARVPSASPPHTSALCRC
jgi:hypothetical protein